MLEAIIQMLIDPITLVWALVWIIGFYWLAVFSLAVYAAHKKGYLHSWHYVLFCIPLIVFLLLDFVSNVVLAWYIFKDPPRELLVTQRMSRYRETLPPTDRKHQIAVWVCELNLNIFDPGHC